MNILKPLSLLESDVSMSGNSFVLHSKHVLLKEEWFAAFAVIPFK